jgi:ligand-binding sensor domain-containing protein
MITALLTSLALAAPQPDQLDPWGRPTHARVAIEPPASIEDLYATERQFRFWWDDTGATATIEIRGKLRWRTLATDVPLGWISEDLPRDSVFRIRLEGGARTSKPLSAPRFYGPTDLARLPTEASTLLSDVILDVEPQNESTLWGAAYTGGLIQINTKGSQQTIRTWTRWDGLPDDRVLSVSVDDDVTWVGTANGLAKIYNNQVLQVWQEELADPYVQSLDAEDGVTYIGTYQGLDRLSGQFLEHMLPQWSVFSILTDGQRTAVGYEGITFINDKDTVSTQDWPGNVSALAQVNDTLWMATDSKGLVQSGSDGTTVIFEEEIHDILPVDDLVYLVGDKEVWSISSTPEPDTEPTGELVGLSTMYTIAHHQEALWVGTSHGLTIFNADHTRNDKVQASPWLSHKAVHGLLPSNDDHGLIVSLEDGLTPMSVTGDALPHRVLEDWIHDAALHEDQNGIWVWSGSTIQQIQNESLQSHAMDSTVVGITEWLGHTWVATESSLMQFADQTFLEKQTLENIREISSDGRSLWLRTDDSIHYVTPSDTTEYETPSAPTSIAPSGLTVCVGTEDGLFRLWKGRTGDQMWEDPLGAQDHDVQITSVLGDDRGGCWMAGEDGTVGYVDKDGYATWWHLPNPDPPAIDALVLDRGQMWVLTEEGAWLLW